MFTPDRAAAAIATHSKKRNRHFASLDDVACDLGMGQRPRDGALDWANGIIDAVIALGAGGAVHPARAS